MGQEMQVASRSWEGNKPQNCKVINCFVFSHLVFGSLLEKQWEMDSTSQGKVGSKEPTHDCFLLCSDRVCIQNEGEKSRGVQYELHSPTDKI